METELSRFGNLGVQGGIANPSRELELTGDEFKRILEVVGGELALHLDSLSGQPSWGTDRQEDRLHHPLDPSIGREKCTLDSALRYLFDVAIPCSFNTASPGYLAYIPGGGLPLSGIADLIATVTNRYTGVFAAAPLLANLEHEVNRWLAGIFGFPESSGGILTSGGSLANWSAMIAAREKLLGEEISQGVVYCSDQAHHCIEKAVRLCGIRRENIQRVPVDARFRIRPDELANRIAADRKRGLVPFLVAANGGTTNSGAVDPLEAIADICQRERIWFHVDAAYGGFFMLTERGQKVLQGIQRADSVVVDPHKGMFLPYGTGALIVRDVRDLQKAHRIDADYLPDGPDEANPADFHCMSAELSRDFRGLRVWLPLKIHGPEIFRQLLDEKLDLTEWALERLRGYRSTESRIEIVAPPELSLFAFRVTFPAAPERQEQLNRDLLERVNRRRRVYLTSTRLNDLFVLRICVLSFRTHLEQMEMALDDLFAAIAEIENEI